MGTRWRVGFNPLWVESHVQRTDQEQRCKNLNVSWTPHHSQVPPGGSSDRSTVYSNEQQWELKKHFEKSKYQVQLWFKHCWDKFSRQQVGSYSNGSSNCGAGRWKGQEVSTEWGKCPRASTPACPLFPGTWSHGGGGRFLQAPLPRPSELFQPSFCFQP